MASNALTISIATANTVITSPTVPSNQWQVLVITNMDATNAVWVRGDAFAAVAEADENIIVRAGETIEIPWVPSFRAIAITAAVKLHVWGRP